MGGEAGDLLLAEGVAQVVEGRAVADPRAEQPRAVVGEDRFGAVAPPAVGGLAHVLKHGEQLHALARAGGGDLVEVGQRRDVRRLIQREQQRGLDRLAALRRAGERARGDVGDQGGEQAAQAALVIRR